MNRQQRRQMKRQETLSAPGAGQTGSAAAARFFAQAVQHFQAGRLSEATDLYRQALVADPRHAASLHHLGVLALKIGRSDAAADMIGRAIDIDSTNADYHHDIALALYRLERCHDAIQHAKIAIALKPAHSSAHMLLGDSLLKQQRWDEAIAAYRQGLALAPDNAEAHYNIAEALYARQQRSEAAQHFEEALRLNPSLVAVHQFLAEIYVAEKNFPRGFEAIMQSLRVAETPRSKAIFCHCLPRLKQVTLSNDLYKFVVRAISEPWTRPNKLSTVCTALIKTDPAIAAAIARAESAWPKRLSLQELLGQRSTFAGHSLQLLCTFMEHMPVHDIATERFLTLLRAAFLDMADNADANPVDEALLKLICALARQNFINEYVFDRTEKELEKVALLRNVLNAALRTGAPISAYPLAILATYEPLSGLPESEGLLARSWPAPLNALLNQQVREPAAERAIRAQIPQLTQIENDISVQVQQQYEENPYPRWVKCAPSTNTMPIDDRMARQFPHARFRTLGKRDTLDVLIAGCGTGHQVVESARRSSGARILAIDLSMTSLSYAKYRTDGLSLDNVEYGQADILKLASLGRTFDVIECGGVLHHLADPLEGWRVLLSLLRPNGIMLIALYSELARADVVAGRAFIAERGYGSSADGIRRCRQEIMALDEQSPARRVIRRADFFTASTCRDLLFHVQEHRFKLPQIKRFLADNKLELLGFEFDSDTPQDYSARFPDDVAHTNLDNWHLFELENPETFGRMYQFYVQKQD